MSQAANELDRVDARYDPENDLIGGAPRVTHTDKVLIDVVREILEEIGDRAAIEDIHDILSYVRDLGMIRAEVLAISKDLHSIKIEISQIVEDRDALLTTLGAIEAQISEIRREEGLDKLERIRQAITGTADFGRTLDDITEILAE